MKIFVRLIDEGGASGTWYDDDDYKTGHQLLKVLENDLDFIVLKKTMIRKSQIKLIKYRGPDHE